MSIIVAVEMSSQPFKSFQFDGILGLGLPGLTMSRLGQLQIVVAMGLIIKYRDYMGFYGIIFGIMGINVIIEYD